MSKHTTDTAAHINTLFTMFTKTGHMLVAVGVILCTVAVVQCNKY